MHDEDDTRTQQLDEDEEDMFAPSTSKGAGKCKAVRNSYRASNVEQTPPKKARKTTKPAEKAKKPGEEGGSMFNILREQVKLLQEAQEKDDTMMKRLTESWRRSLKKDRERL